MIGGLIRFITEKSNKSDDEKKEIINNGILFSSGMIAGEGLMGIILALFAIIGIENLFDISGLTESFPYFNITGGAIILIATIVLVFKFSSLKRINRNER